MTLTDKQKTFCQEYIIDFNATQSAIRAGYSERTAPTTGSRLLMNDKVQAEIMRLKSERSKRTEVTADRVIAQLARIAFMDVKEFVEWGAEESSEIIDYDENDEPVRETRLREYVRFADPGKVDGTLIQSIKMGKHGLIMEFPDRMKALEALAKHTGVYDERPNVTVDVTGFVEALEQTAKKVGGLWDDDLDDDPGGDPNDDQE